MREPRFLEGLENGTTPVKIASAQLSDPRPINGLAWNVVRPK